MGMVGYMIWLVFIIEFWLNNQVKNFLWYLLNDYTTTMIKCIQSSTDSSKGSLWKINSIILIHFIEKFAVTHILAGTEIISTRGKKSRKYGTLVHASELVMWLVS